MSFLREFERAGDAVPVRVEPQGEGRYRVRVGSRTLLFRADPLDEGGVRLVPLHDDGAPAGAATVAFGAPGPARGYQVRLQGRTWTLRAPERRAGGSGGGADGSVRAPMTGTVTKVMCRVGDTVQADQTLIVLTAMKMEHKLTAGVAGVVESLAASEGGTADMGEVLAVVTPSQ